ncbi:MAG: GtrA family protein [Muribaculaceae bacterium]|nr:GtrA family protein [Muribaculaceae bacterium]
MKILADLDAGKKEALMQFVRYGLVGVLNTVVTLVVIFVCKSLLGVNDYVSNAIGYVAGVINSFIWNRQFVFHSHGRLSREMTLFLIGFGICYCVQFAIVWTINQSPFGTNEFDLGFFVISGYGVATLIGMVGYTICNFIYNRCIAFKKAP